MPFKVAVFKVYVFGMLLNLRAVSCSTRTPARTLTRTPARTLARTPARIPVGATYNSCYCANEHPRKTAWRARAWCTARLDVTESFYWLAECRARQRHARRDSAGDRRGHTAPNSTAADTPTATHAPRDRLPAPL